MSDNGVKSDLLDPVTLVTDVLVNGPDGTGAQPIDTFSAQLLAAGPLSSAVADTRAQANGLQAASVAQNARLTAVEANQTTGQINVSTWAELAGIAVTYEKQGAEVPDTDTGMHTDPLTATTVPNAGRYQGYVGYGWRWISVTGISRKADKTETADIKANAKATLSQHLTTGGGEWSEMGVDPNDNIGWARRAATGGLLTPVEQITHVTPTGVASLTQYTVAALEDYDEVHIDANGYIGFIRYLDGRTVGNTQVDELISARGAQQSLNARLNRGLTDFGDSASPIQNASRLRRTRAKIHSMRAGVTTQLGIADVGDSWRDSQSYGIAALRTRLLASGHGNGNLANGGPGYIGLASAQAGVSTGIHRSVDSTVTVSRTGTWTDLFHSADGTVGMPQTMPDADAVSSSTPGSRHIINGLSGALEGLKLFFLPGGSVRTSWDGGSTWFPLDLSAGSGPQAIDVPRTGQTTSLIVEVVSGTVTLGGLYAKASLTLGLVVNKWASSGSAAMHWASLDQTLLAAAWGLADVDLLMLTIAANDVKYGRTPQQCADDVQTLIATMRTAHPGVDVLVQLHPDIYYSGVASFQMHELSPYMRAMAADNDAAFIDLQSVFGARAPTPPFYAPYQNGAANSLLGPDNRHPSNTGGVNGAALIADADYRIMINMA